jgi:hypothetical protein
MNGCFMGCDPSPDSEERFFVMGLQEFTIYGHTVDRWTRENYPEDLPHVEQGNREGRQWACYHSPACPDGELGTNDARALIEITYDDFVAANEAGWPHLPLVTTAAPAVAIFVPDDEGNLVKHWDSLRGNVA